MFFAINSKTKEKVNSLTLESNASYEFIKDDTWYADPDEIEFCPKTIDVNKIDVCFREGKVNIINFKGTKYDIAPHFYIPNKTKLGINTIPESKEHKSAKNWIHNRLFKQRDFDIVYASISKPIKYNEKISLLGLPIDKELVGIEVNSSTFGGKRTRRADVICPFIIKHPLFGNGIVFEIQFSNQRENTRLDRESDWAIRGYSVCWLYKDDFEFITDTICDLKENKVKVSSWISLIKSAKKEYIKNLRFEVQELSRQLDLKKWQIFEEVSERFNKISNNEIEEVINEIVKGSIKKNFQPTCGKCNTPATVRINRNNNSKFWSCSNYPHCKGWSMPYDE